MSRFSWLPMTNTRCSIVEDAWSSPATSCTAGSSRNSSTSVATPWSRVAEKSSRWPPCGGVADDALHRLEEPEVAHVVGLVDHRDDDLGEVETTLLDEVLDAAGRADHDVDAALERADLAVLRHAAVDLRGEEADALRDGLHGAVDLQGELAGGGEDERAGLAAHLALAARLARLGPERHEALDRGGAEGDGLARAGLAAAEDVAALEHDRDRRGLDRERRLGAEVLQRAHDVVAEPEVGEGHAVDRVGLDGLGLEALEHHVIGRREARAAVLRRVEARRAAARLLEAGDGRSRGAAHGHRGRTTGPGGPGGRTNERDARHGRGAAHGRHGRTNGPGGPGGRTNERDARHGRDGAHGRHGRTNEPDGHHGRTNEQDGRTVVGTCGAVVAVERTSGAVRRGAVRAVERTSRTLVTVTAGRTVVTVVRTDGTVLAVVRAGRAVVAVTAGRTVVAVVRASGTVVAVTAGRTVVAVERASRRSPRSNERGARSSRSERRAPRSPSLRGLARGAVVAALAHGAVRRAAGCDALIARPAGLARGIRLFGAVAAVAGAARAGLGDPARAGPPFEPPFAYEGSKFLAGRPPAGFLFLGMVVTSWVVLKYMAGLPGARSAQQV